MVTRPLIRGVGDSGLSGLDRNGWTLHQDRTTHIFDLLRVSDFEDVFGHASDSPPDGDECVVLEDIEALLVYVARRFAMSGV